MDGNANVLAATIGKKPIDIFRLKRLQFVLRYVIVLLEYNKLKSRNKIYFFTFNRVSYRVYDHLK